MPNLTLWLFKTKIRETQDRKGWYSWLLPSLPKIYIDITLKFTSPSVSKRFLKVSQLFERVIKLVSSKTAISLKCRWPSHINLLETEEKLLSVLHLASIQSFRGLRFLALVEQKCSLGAITEVRSSSYALNTVCRNISQVFLEAHITQIPHCVPSTFNLTDGPSGIFENFTSILLPV